MKKKEEESGVRRSVVGNNTPGGYPLVHSDDDEYQEAWVLHCILSTKTASSFKEFRFTHKHHNMMTHTKSIYIEN